MTSRVPEQGHMQPLEASLPRLERCQRLPGDAPTDSRERLAYKACSGWVLLTLGQLDQPTDVPGELGFHFESVLHARHTEYVCIGYAAQLNWRSIITRRRETTNLG